jgi:hypothetical protein
MGLSLWVAAAVEIRARVTALLVRTVALVVAATRAAARRAKASAKVMMVLRAVLPVLMLEAAVVVLALQRRIRTVRRVLRHLSRGQASTTRAAAEANLTPRVVRLLVALVAVRVLLLVVALRMARQILVAAGPVVVVLMERLAVTAAQASLLFALSLASVVLAPAQPAARSRRLWVMARMVC